MELVTGVKSLDAAIGGLQYGSLVTLAGRPCMRTEYFIYTLMRSWIKVDVVKEGFVFFSLKDKKERVYRHLFGSDYTDEAIDAKYIVEMHRSGIELSVLCDKIRSAHTRPSCQCHQTTILQSTYCLIQRLESCNQFHFNLLFNVSIFRMDNLSSPHHWSPTGDH